MSSTLIRWCGDHSYKAASEAIERDQERMVIFCDNPEENRRHLRTTNPMVSPSRLQQVRSPPNRIYKLLT